MKTMNIMTKTNQIQQLAVNNQVQFWNTKTNFVDDIPTDKEVRIDYLLNLKDKYDYSSKFTSNEDEVITLLNENQVYSLTAKIVDIAEENKKQEADDAYTNSQFYRYSVELPEKVSDGDITVDEYIAIVKADGLYESMMADFESSETDDMYEWIAECSYLWAECL